MTKKKTVLSSPRIGQGVLHYSDKQSFDNVSLFGVPQKKSTKLFNELKRKK